jgi:hypothetical protein
MIIDPKFPFRSRMIENNFDPTFTFTKELVLRAYDFGREQYRTSKDRFEKRGQRASTNIIEQCQTSKVVEEANYAQLISYLPNLSSPDWNIYEDKNKNWDPDLSDKTLDPAIKIGIKSQRVEIGDKFGVSWIFEFRAGKNYDVDRGVFGEEAKKPGHFICFNSIDMMGKRGELKAIVAVSTLHELKLFEAVKIESLQNNKVAVYLDSLVKKVKK